MNAQTPVIRQSELINRLVLDRRTAEELGRIDHLWLNPKLHQVMGFTCKSGFLGGRKYSFTWRQIESIGADSIMVNFKVEEFADPKKSEDIFPLLGHELWTESGNKVGKIVDYLLVPETGVVVNYLFTSSGWYGILNVVYLLPINCISSIGGKRLIVPNTAVEKPQQYGSLQEKIGQVADILKEDYKKTQAELQSLKRGVQDIAGQMKDKAQDIAEQLKDKEVDDSQEGNRALPPAVDIIEIKAELIKDESKEK